MAKNVIRTSEWYERTTKNGTYQKRRFNAVALSQSRIARQMTAEAGWTKVAGNPVGVENAAKAKATPAKPKSNAKQVEVPADEQPEQNVEIE